MTSKPYSSNTAHSRLSAGPWRGVIVIQGRELPFQMNVEHRADDVLVEFINGEERVPVNEIRVHGDDVALVLPAFNTRMELAFVDGRLEGTLVKVTGGGKAQRMPVTLIHGEAHRFFLEPEVAHVDVSGRWTVTFTEPDGKSYPAVGEFRQNGHEVTGTFLTPTSDHRYLAGEIRDGRLYLSAWDGYHVFLYEADVAGDAMQGRFFSGAAWNETWTAVRDPAAALPDMDAQTTLKDAKMRFDFTFPDERGVPHALSDDTFRDKAVVVQLAASWCPNCADAVRFLAPWYRNNRERGIEVVALMFEHFEDFETAAARVRIWRETYGVEYRTLIAGLSDKRQASTRLPQLDAVRALPTTLFVGADGRVARIHTGFNGPATGEHYERETAEFNATVDALLQETH